MSIMLQPVTLMGHLYEKVRARIEGYAEGGGIAVQLDCDEDGYWEPLTTLTVNVPDDPRPGTLVWAKDYSENEGIIDSLEAQGLVRRTGLTRPSGFVSLDEVELRGALADAVAEDGDGETR